MGLNFGGGQLFQGNPIYGNDGEMEVSVFQQNYSENAAWTGHDAGNAIDIFDRDTSTYVSLSHTTDGTRYITATWLGKQQNMVVNVVYGVTMSTPGGGDSVRPSIEISDDNSTWVEIANGPTNDQTWTGNHNGVHSFKYLRIVGVWASSDGTSNALRLYEATITKGE